MRLVIAAREQLRAQLRAHPHVARQIGNKSDVASMGKDELLALAGKLNVDVAAIIADVEKNGDGYESILEDDAELDRRRHTHKCPGFAGTYEFLMTFSALGKRFTRMVRAVYTHTPDWEYYDIKKQALFQGYYLSVIHFEIRAESDKPEKKKSGRPRKRKRRRTASEWYPVDLNQMGVFSEEFWWQLRDKIDERCQLEDAVRRKTVAAGKKVKGPPPQLKSE